MGRFWDLLGFVGSLGGSDEARKAPLRRSLLCLRCHVMASRGRNLIILIRLNDPCEVLSKKPRTAWLGSMPYEAHKSQHEAA